MIAPRLTTVARTALVQHQRRGFYSVTPGLPQVRVSFGVSILLDRLSIGSSLFLQLRFRCFTILCDGNHLITWPTKVT